MPSDAKGRNFTGKVGRRRFIGTAAVTAGAMIIKPTLVHGSEANSAIRVGLLGCGGRGTEDATNLIDAGGARVVAQDNGANRSEFEIRREGMRTR